MYGVKNFANIDVMGGQMMFGPIVGVVCLAWLPEELELLLAFSVSQPVEVHVHGFCAFFRLDFGSPIQ
jgi:hypothetical protein